MRVIAIALVAGSPLFFTGCGPAQDGCNGGCPSGTACDVAEDSCVAVASAVVPERTAPAAPPHESWTGAGSAEAPLAGMPHSCAEVKQLNNAAKSGPTIVASPDGTAVTLDCDQDTDGGGYTIIADINWSILDPTSCPVGWTWTLGGCAHASGVDVVSQARFAVPVPHYSDVRGRVIATINDTNHAFAKTDDIDSVYVDGLSITAGEAPRQHVFTFAAAAVIDAVVFKTDDCPKQLGDFGNRAPPFVGDGFHCDDQTSNTWAGERVFDTHADFQDAPLLDARLMATADGYVFVQQFLLMVR
jgi:hypothetical protein